jgi:hypothetical protein
MTLVLVVEHQSEASSTTDAIVEVLVNNLTLLNQFSSNIEGCKVLQIIVYEILLASWESNKLIE